MSHPEDQALIARCLSGSRDAMELLVRTFSNSVYRSTQYALKSKEIRYSREDLEDLHNSVFLSLFEDGCRKLRQYKGENGCSLATWIRLITVRTVIDYLRKMRTDALGVRKKMPIEFLESFRSDEPDLMADMERDEQWRLIKDGMKDLLPRDRLFLTLHCEDGLSTSEIADLMDIPRENVNSIKHRAIKRLRKAVFNGSRRQGAK
jgi:RNA polymerase sigma factor (sigma-70 family)